MSNPGTNRLNSFKITIPLFVTTMSSSISLATPLMPSVSFLISIHFSNEKNHAMFDREKLLQVENAIEHNKTQET